MTCRACPAPRCVWRLVPVFLTLIVFNAIYAQVRLGQGGKTSDGWSAGARVASSRHTPAGALPAAHSPRPLTAPLTAPRTTAAQMTTLFVLQGEGMDCNLFGLKVAPATVSGAQAGWAGPLAIATHAAALPATAAGRPRTAQLFSLLPLQ